MILFHSIIEHFVLSFPFKHQGFQLDFSEFPILYSKILIIKINRKSDLFFLTKDFIQSYSLSMPFCSGYQKDFHIKFGFRLNFYESKFHLMSNLKEYHYYVPTYSAILYSLEKSFDLFWPRNITSLQFSIKSFLP